MSKTHMALTTCNVPWNDTLTLEEFMELVHGKRAIDKWVGHISIMMNEVHPNILSEMANENHIHIADLEKLFFKLPIEFQSKHATEFFKNNKISDNYC